MGDYVPLGSRDYFMFLTLLLYARGSDMLSTWMATPNLLLEANPLARKLGWTWGIPVNLAVCVIFARWPLPAIIISTTSALVAAHNFQYAWAMRVAGEEGYRKWFLDRLEETPPSLFLFCLFGQTLLVGTVGGLLVFFSDHQLVPLGIGMGIVAYAFAVVLFTLLAVGRMRRSPRSMPPHE